MSQIDDRPWYDTTTADHPTMQDLPDLEPTSMIVRPQGGQVARRSEYGELAELASAGGPRDVTRMLAEAKRVGALLGERGFYSWRQAGQLIEGPSIDLMDALSIVWGRIIARVEIVDEDAKRVHLRGRVVDLLTLTCVERDYVSAIAPAPAGYAKKQDQADRWHVMQMQAASSKAIRGALEHALPAWFVDAGLAAAKSEAAQRATGGKPLPEARELAVKALGQYGLAREHLEAWLEQPLDLWAAEELGRLRALRDQLKAGSVAVEQVRATALQRAATAQPQAAQAAQGDRLASLGLQRPAAQEQRQPDPGLSGGQGPAQDDGKEPLGPNPEKQALLVRIHAAEGALPRATVEQVRARNGLAANQPPSARLKVSTLEQLAAEYSDLMSQGREE